MDSKGLIRWISLLVMLLGLAGTTAGETIYVDVDAASGGDGTSWASAYQYLQDALARAGSGDEVWVAEGSYRPDQHAANPSGTNDRNATFHLRSDIAWYGGFVGTETSRDQRNWQSNVTTLTGDIGALGDNSDNCYSVVTAIDAWGEPLVDGFTITGGYRGGMFNLRSSPTVTNCTFSGNEAIMGGGMLNEQSNSTVTNCTFSGNEANVGAGMFNGECSPIVTDCTFSGNSANYTGSGMYNMRSDAIVTDCTFSENRARDGGGMGNYESSPSVADCTFSRNEVRDGGGMYNKRSNPTLTHCTFSGNIANHVGGGIHNDDSAPTVVDCEFTGNVAHGAVEVMGTTRSGSGGGICNIESSPTILRCLFSGNSAANYNDPSGGSGGGIFNCMHSSPYIENW